MQVTEQNTPLFSHKPVMLQECMDALAIRPDGTYADLTAGGAGHSSEIARRLGEGGHLIAIDQDADAIAAASKRLSPFGDRVELVRDNFSNIAAILGGRQIDGFLIDLGVSSFQLDTPERGFSYMNDAPLDMRMNRDAPLTAYDVVNTYGREALAGIIYRYGEERFASRIAAQIEEARAQKPIETTLELVDIIKRAIPARAREGGHHPAKRTFQAIRIEVNHELDRIEPTLRDAIAALKPGGRAAVITFHSLEDRIVKQTFASLMGNCTCPHDFPVCICGCRATVAPVGRKPILPSEEELEDNPRSRSAKLRTVQKL